MELQNYYTVKTIRRINIQNFLLPYLFLIFLLIYPLKSFSFETDIQAVITPSRLNLQKYKTSATISVITGKQLEHQKAFSIEEALRNLPGVYVQAAGTPGEQTIIRIRGADGDQILVLVNGVQVNSPWNGYFDFANLTTDNVERIEVLKGNQSALYGSDALGGVINVITKKGRGGLKSSVKAGAGNQKTYREVFNNERGWEKFNYSFSVSRIDSSGQYEKDSYSNTSLSGQAELKLSDSLSMEHTMRYNKAYKEIGVSFFSVSSSLLQSFFDENWSNNNQLFLNNLTIKHQPTGMWSYTIQGSIVSEELVLDDKASPESNVDYFFTLNTVRYTIRNQHDFYIGKNDIITFGVEYKEEKADRLRESPSILQIKEKKNNLGIYFQNILTLNNVFFLTTGFRADKYTGFGYTYNPKISAAYRFLSTGTKIKSSWGTGFKAPSIQELYTPVLGNPDLKPEKTNSYEVGIEQQMFDHRVKIELVFFHTDFEDLIQRSQTGVDNIGKAKTEGIEFSIHYFPISNLDLSGNYTFQKAENKDTGTPLRRPENIWNFNIFYKHKEKLDLNLDISIVGEKFYDYDFIWVDGTRLEGALAGYQKIDLAFSYLVKKWSYTNELKVFTKINNLLDQEYFENKGFKAPGITFFTGLQLSF